MPNGTDAAQRARNIANRPGMNNPAWVALSQALCWDAVVQCAYDAGAITKQRYDLLYKKISKTIFSNFVSRNDQQVRKASDLLAVPEGAFLGFVEHPTIEDPTYSLSHAMLYLSGGEAAGTKNRCIAEIGSPVGWEIINLFWKLPFYEKDHGTVLGRNVEYCIKHGPRKWSLHYRAFPYFLRL